jgi:hypothetical protein
MPLELLARTSLLGGGLDRAQRPVSTMPLQDLQIGSLEFPKVSFFTFSASSEGLSRTSAYDGLLTLGIFRRVFICHAHHFAVFEPCAPIPHHNPIPWHNSTPASAEDLWRRLIATGMTNPLS